MISRRYWYHSQTILGFLSNASNVASSSGLNFFQSPSSPRKVGTPDSAETPAPVETTTVSAFLRASINLSENSIFILPLKIGYLKAGVNHDLYFRPVVQRLMRIFELA